MTRKRTDVKERCVTHRLQVAMDRRKSEQETEKLGMKAGLK